MKVSRILASLCLSSGGLALVRRQRLQPGNEANGTALQPKQYILEFEAGSDFTAIQSSIAARQGTTIKRVFDTDIFAGVSVESTGENVDTLSAIKSVAQVWPSRIITINTTEPSRSWSAADAAGEAASANYSVHAQTGVDKLHAQGIYGKGVVIGIVDTGTQYTHPALGGCFGEGCKVAGGYDLVGDGCWPVVGCDVEPDDDPMDDIGHGTHVAGIAVGQSSDGLFVGVAPEATILSYKVFTAYDGTTEDVLIEAFLMAYEAGVDIITSSVGGASGWSTDAWAVVASRIADKGIIVTIAAGNDGIEGPYYASNGAAGQHVLAVASIEAETTAENAFLANFTLENQNSSAAVGYYEGSHPITSAYTGYPIYPVSLDTNSTDDACSALSVNLTGKVALVRVASCDGTVQQTNVQNAGAHVTLWYQADDPYTIPNYKHTGGFVGTISADSGVAIVETVRAGGTVIADFTTINADNYFVGMPNPSLSRGLPDYYTSWGPLYDLTIKPDIAAPGGNILSTYPTDTYAVLSGTSMATPYIAGVAALYIGYLGGRKTNSGFNSRELMMRIISSGDSLSYFDGSTETDYGLYAPIAQIGTGIINATKVLGFTTSLSYAKFELNDTQHFSRQHSVKITNGADVEATYTYDLQGGAGFETWSPDDDTLLDFVELAPISAVPSVSYPAAVTLGPGETRTVDFNFEYPSGLDNLPLYSGKVLVNSSLGESLAIPYLGLAASLEETINDQWETGYPYSVSGLSATNSSAKSSYTFNLSTSSQDFPKMYARTQWGTKELRWDVFAADWTEREWVYPPVIGSNAYTGSATYWLYSGEVTVYDSSQYPNDTVAFPISDEPRSSIEDDDLQFWWFGGLANGSQIAPGSYVWRFAALVPFGDPTRSTDWSSFTTSFTVLST
ncbi:hypothetical protein VPNG_02185 [Cytospora leucostoma]|uniref:Uncharacterized protein n=1 Tax=Cytospora leucostoma TaxID=1230097 RepID=A0A423XH07_9PEZI|nr:hypothetical protein VPNG_02185 [Cytospora leucostoma]